MDTNTPDPLNKAVTTRKSLTKEAKMVSERVRQRRKVITELARDGKTIPEIAEALGISKGLVSSDLNALGIKARRAPMPPMRLPGQEITTADRDRERRALLAPLAAQGLSWHEIADVIGMPWPKVREILVRLGIKTVPHKRFRGTTPRVAARRAKVARMVQEGMTTRQISVAIGEAIGTIGLDRKALGMSPGSEAAMWNAQATSDLAVSVTELLLTGLTVVEVAAGLGVPVSEVDAIVDAFDVRGALREAGKR